ncbi:type II secretion system protein GspD [Costertonia aggregata]|uniref:General secretion pathway protein GspD n=1 Tax=Costertonia aggregata TaxID=343403 RepID=A0A7H9ATG1_9FLAO|nr:general secretion pathway protein GspD [Costertonia aggregata]QLG46771.1 general secretion pathway protein GspD [Costertonia aggregata]
MRKILLIACFAFSSVLYTQEENRIQNIKNNLELLAVENSGLTENLKLDVNVTNVTLSNFLLAISQVHKVNINVDPSLQGINIVNNFSNVTVADLLVFLCKEYNLDINFSGNILSIKKYNPPPPEIIEKEIKINFDPTANLISMDLEQDGLEKVFRKIMDITGQNLLFGSGMEQLPLNIYLKAVPLETGLAKLAEVNNLVFSKSRDGFYLFDQKDIENSPRQAGRNRIFRDNLKYEVLDSTNRILKVDFVNTPIATIINEISLDLNLDVYTATPLEQAGNVTFKANEIYYDTLLERIFESSTKSEPIDNRFNGNNSQVPNTNGSSNRGNSGFGNTTSSVNAAATFTYKKEDGIYFFGLTDQLSVRRVEVIQMMHRSIELLGDPSQSGVGSRMAGRTIGGNVNYLGNTSGIQGGIQGNQGFSNQGFNNQSINSSRRINTQYSSFDNYDTNVEALVSILPDDIIADLDIKIDFELNSFLVSGPAANINRFKSFIKEIDKPVPVILIEVMLIEVKKSATVETGISWGIADTPTTTQGGVFPQTDLTLGANTVNKIIGGFDGFGSFNIGKVVPNFFATIKAMEENGNLKIRSTPKLSTLNGHRANLSIGETTYYVVTNQNFFGSQIPTTSEVRNYQPIDAQLAVSIKPLVSGNGQVTLDINVIQSDFSGERIEDDAPPGLTSREFSSIIRMQDQDLAVLGGLEEKIKNDSGSGVPFLARVPVIKWLFSKRKREDSKQKLTILIKPTVIY